MTTLLTESLPLSWAHETTGWEPLVFTEGTGVEEDREGLAEVMGDFRDEDVMVMLWCGVTVFALHTLRGLVAVTHYAFTTPEGEQAWTRWQESTLPLLLPEGSLH